LAAEAASQARRSSSKRLRRPSSSRPKLRTTSLEIPFSICLRSSPEIPRLIDSPGNLDSGAVLTIGCVDG
jgi:hypothetical protein